MSDKIHQVFTSYLPKFIVEQYKTGACITDIVGTGIRLLGLFVKQGDIRRAEKQQKTHIKLSTFLIM